MRKEGERDIKEGTTERKRDIKEGRKKGRGISRKKGRQKKERKAKERKEDLDPVTGSSLMLKNAL